MATKKQLEKMLAELNRENAALEDEAKKLKHAYRQAEYDLRGEAERLTIQNESLDHELGREQSARARARKDALTLARLILGMVEWELNTQPTPRR